MKPFLICLALLIVGCSDIGDSPAIIPETEIQSPCAQYWLLEFEKINLAFGVNFEQVIIATPENFTHWRMKPLQAFIDAMQEDFGRFRRASQIY